ncbi:MAG: hypothetical protein KA740_08845 [Rhodoferax sp.]|jgi:hypothetical protein|nr:hypothetical protein [Rhodoferax sp.]
MADTSFPDTALVAETTGGVRSASGQFRASLSGDMLVYLAIAAVVAAMWKISRMGLFEAGDDVGYWIGVVGAVMMVLLFTYPLRKYFNFARNWGRVKWWFLAHMILGIGGPALILLHSNFRVGSINAAVALYSMLAVAASGVIGRFIYARVNRGLRGEQSSLRELRDRAGLQQADAKSRLAFAPRVEARLAEFESSVSNTKPSWVAHTRQVFWLPIQQWLVYRQCAAELKTVLERFQKKNNWSLADWQRHERHSKELVSLYLNAVTRVAQFTAYERLFSLWHIVHIPFVYSLIISSLVHVYAVHVY